MKPQCLTLLCICVALLLADQAQASLIGDTVRVQFSSFPVTPAVTVVSPGVELPGASLSTFGSSGTTPRWDINIENNFIVIDFPVSATYGVGASFTFSDLDWVGPPGPGIVTGVSATSNQTVIPLTTSFTSGSVKVNFGSNTFNWQAGNQIVLDIQTAHVPEPAGAALMGIGSLILMVRRKATIE